MDKKSLAVVSICVAIMIAWDPLVNKLYPPAPLPSHKTEPSIQGKGAAQQQQSPAQIGLPSAKPEPIKLQSESYAEAPVVASIENGFARYDFVAEMTGIRSVTLKKHLGITEGPMVINGRAPGPILELQGLGGEWQSSRQPEIVSDDSSVTFKTQGKGVRLEKVFSIQPDYSSKVALSFINEKSEPVRVDDFWVSCGVGAPVHENDMAMYIGLNAYNGNDFIAKTMSELEQSGFLFITFSQARPFIEDVRPFKWVASHNQFFVTLAQMKNADFAGYRMEQVILPKFRQQQEKPPVGIRAWALVKGFNIPANTSHSIEMDIYSGPREYERLRDLGDGKHLVMNFGFWEWVSIPLLNTMNFINGWVKNYGISIILMVILIKAAFWPLQSKSNKTMKQMQAIQPKLKELQEKYKEDPQKMQVETMGLYQTYGINPLGGCLPMFVQIPVFFGFYSMLQSAVELRNAPFLWIHDLSQPDTVCTMPGIDIPINPLPLVMGLTSVWQMNITPSTGMDKAQATMMKMMPLIFIVICYNFSSALSLYWTVQNLISIAQMYHNLHEPPPKLEKVKARPKSRWHAMMEMAKQQAELEKQKKKKK